MSEGLALARELALAGAAAAVIERTSDAFEPTRPFPDARGDFAALGSRMRAWLESRDPTLERLARRLGLREAGVWTVLLCAASERFPEVAQRFVFLTGGAFLQSAADFLAAVPNAHLEKPLKASELSEFVEAFLLTGR